MCNNAIKYTKQKRRTLSLHNKRKNNPDQNKINNAHQHLQDIEAYKINGTILRSKEKVIEEQDKPKIFFFDQEKQTKIKNH